PYRSEYTHYNASITKSVVSALAGIAVDEGAIDNIQDSVLPYFSDMDIDASDSTKQQMTIDHLLTMTSGLEWRESSVPYSSPQNSYFQATISPDSVQFTLDQPMEAPPGTLFNYNTGSTNVLAAILEKVTDQSIY